MARLITVEEVKSIALPRKNISQSLIKDSYIEKAELKHIKEVIGKDFYDELVSQNGTTDLTDDNKALLDDHLKKSLAFYVILEIAEYMFVDITNAGIQTQGTEFTESVTTRQKADLMQQIRDDGDVFKDEMVEFLIAQQDADDTKYPLFESTKDINEDYEVIGGVAFDKEDRPRQADEGIDKGRSLRDC